MAAWKTCKLGEVADVATGNSNREDAVENGKYPLYDRSPEVKRSNRYLFDFPEGAVIVPGEGQAFVPRFARGKFDLHQRAYEVSPKRVEGKPPEADARYLYYFLMDNRDYFARVATGSTVKSLRQWMFHEMPLSLPSLSEQECIAGVLGAYDDLIAVNARRMALLEEAAHRLYRERFVTHADPAWPSRPLGEVAALRRGKTITEAHAQKGRIPVVAGGLEPAYWHSQANTVAPVLTVAGSGANAGFARLYYEDVWASDCSYVDSSGEAPVYFAYCFLKDHKRAIENLQRGAAQPHVYPSELNALEGRFDMEAVQAFEEQVGPYFEAVGALARENALLREARDGLLPRLLREEA